MPSKEKLVIDLYKDDIPKHRRKTVLNNFKSFIKQVYQKGWTQLKKKGRLTFNNKENLLFF